MPWPSLRRITSSPAAGLLVVEFFTVPVRVWAAARVVRRRTRAIMKVASRRVDRVVATQLGENALGRRRRGEAGMGSFDFAGSALCSPPATLRMTLFVHF